MDEQISAPKSTKKPMAVIVTIEGLGCNLVGCYGGAIAPTKNWDSFASRGIVFDQFWSDTLLPTDVLKSMWSGVHFASRSSEMDAEQPLPSEGLLERALLVTDSFDVVEQGAHDVFGNVLLAESEEQSSEEPPTHFERLLEAALGRWANQLEEFPILWIHSQGLNGSWDAPYEYRCVMCDEGDPDPPKETTPGVLQITAETDPDEVFGWACAAGGQAMAMDDVWPMIENAVGELGIAQDCLQILAGVSGYPMGEHGWVGYGARMLYSETLHLPLVIRPGDSLNLGIRVPFMVQPNSIYKTLANWMGGSPESLVLGSHEGDSSSQDLLGQTDAFPAEHWPLQNQLAFASFEDQVHVAVAAWSCRWSKEPDSAETGSSKLELYAMPDDRWQQNEISQRALNIADEMTSQRDRWLKWLRDVESTEPREPLSSDLTHPKR